MARDPALEHLQRRMRASDRRAWLRPLTQSEIGDVAARAFQRLGRPILRSTAGPMLICYASVVFFFAFVFPSVYTTSNPNSTETQIAEVFAVIAVALFVALPLFVSGVSFTSALVAQLVSDYVLGNQTDEATARKVAWRSLPRLILSNVIAFALSSGALIVTLILLLVSALITERTSDDNLWPAVSALIGTFGIFPALLIALWLVSRYSLAPAIVALEGYGPIAAMRRSRKLLAGNRAHPAGSGSLIGMWFTCGCVFFAIWLGTWVTMALFSVDVYVRQAMPNVLLGELATQAIAGIPLYSALWVVIPIWSTTATVLYFDRRVRLEAFDLEVLEQDVRRTNRQTRFQL